MYALLDIPVPSTCITYGVLYRVVYLYSNYWIHLQLVHHYCWQYSLRQLLLAGSMVRTTLNFIIISSYSLSIYMHYRGFLHIPFLLMTQYVCGCRSGSILKRCKSNAWLHSRYLLENMLEIYQSSISIGGYFQNI